MLACQNLQGGNMCRTRSASPVRFRHQVLRQLVVHLGQLAQAHHGLAHLLVQRRPDPDLLAGPAKGQTVRQLLR